MSPQVIQLDMRVNAPLNLTLEYARAEYPVDLYYLMDLSYSMRDDKETLASLGKSLQDLLLNFTSDLRLGFGSFVDKTVGPYTDPTPEELESPCRGCVACYGFQNNVELTDDLHKFSDGIGKANVSGNIDWLEGGFDALMQAVVCQREIGWRNNSRRVLIFSTDSGFHMAGDGKLGGIVQPNDGECHLVKGMYTHSSLLDYPSVSHLSKKVRDNAIIIIFAVPEVLLESYTYLTRIIEGSKAAGLSADSSNILDLVRKQYMEISSAVEMQHNASDNVEVTFYTSCLEEMETNSGRCDNLKIGEKVKFRVEVKVLYCPKNSAEWNSTFRIFPIGSQESTFVHLKLNCDCSCEHPGSPNYMPNSPECSYNGTYMCGICSCNEMRFGSKCDCTSSDLISSSNLENDCRVGNSTIDCSGRGTCKCGVCQCDKRGDENEMISGKYCECDNFSCLRGNGELCGGHGICKCRKCDCDPGWKGDDCMCSASKCKQNDQNEICSGHGNCTCGECSCEEGYEGLLCEKHVSSVPLKTQCEECLPCVLCTIDKREDECAENCSSMSIELVDDLEEYGVNCVHQMPDNCRVEFNYIYDNSSVLEVKALSTKDCPLVISAAYTILSVIGAILLVGIITLILWKLIVTQKDKKEYMRFMKEKDYAKWEEEENPLYKHPRTTYRNPAYGEVSS